MVKDQKKKVHKDNKRKVMLLYVAGLLVILSVIIGFFLFKSKNFSNIYVFPENPKQGDTVFVRVKSGSGEVVGNFGEEKLVFYKRGANEWISFLGIDADQKPGDYTLSIETSGKVNFNKQIKVDLANFSSEKAAQAPSSAKTGVTIEKSVGNIIINDNPALKTVLSNLTSKPYFSSPFSFPLSKMEQTGFSFGRFIGFGKLKIQHLGVDLKAPEKTDIYAVNDGKVVATLNLSNYGKTVIIDHGLDIFSMYLHLEEFKVTKGDMVKKGQEIGLSGQTGYVYGPHLHFSMRVGGTRIDPIVFINATQEINNNFILADISYAFSNIIK